MMRLCAAAIAASLLAFLTGCGGAPSADRAPTATGGNSSSTPTPAVPGNSAATITIQNYTVV